jgi:hypothetical protein
MSAPTRSDRGNLIVPFERLQALIALLKSPAEIPHPAREEIAQALDLLYVMQLEEEHAHRRGRPEATFTWMAARVARALVEQHGASRKEAIAASLVEGTEQDFDRVAKAYDKLVKGQPGTEQWQSANIAESVIQRAAQRLPQAPRAERNK